MRAARVLSSLFAFTLVAGFGTRAHAQAPAQVVVREGSSTTLDERYDEERKRGFELAARGDLNDAERAFGNAASLKKSLPEPRYLLGEVRRRNGKLADAAADFKAAMSLAATGKQKEFYAKALAALAVTFERMGELQQARDMWIKAVKFADDNPTGPLTADVARSRVQAIDLVFEREHVYINVRQRIQDRERIAEAAKAP
ncbi:MAG: tetratricopeptide repeat protein [Polyangiales bacterium]|nr:tetratricopeptide repeat protein [Myxococcales bacterium]